jgi:hypothetical protein
MVPKRQAKLVCPYPFTIFGWILGQRNQFRPFLREYPFGRRLETQKYRRSHIWHQSDYVEATHTRAVGLPPGNRSIRQMTY